MWREYLEEPLNNRNMIEQTESFRSISQEIKTNEIEESHFSRNDIKEIMKKMKSNKSPGKYSRRNVQIWSEDPKGANIQNK